MDIRGFITSGILELYVNGLASPEEVKEVEELAAQYPEIRQEIDSIREAMEQYVHAHRVKPPPDLKAKIMGRIEGNPKPRPSKTVNGTSSNQSTSSPTKTYEREKSGGVSASAIATWLLALGLLAALVATYFFIDQNQKTQAELTESKAQLEQLRQECDERQKRDEALKEQFIAIRHQATRPVQMKGTNLAKDAIAVVYWNNVRRTSYLDVVNLPVPPAGKQYQLWAIVEGKPADMGVFDVNTDSNELQSVPFIENPQAFAVTLEPKGGSVSPTLDQMYVVGSVGKG